MLTRQIYKRLILLTGIVAPLLLFLSQAESLWKYSSVFSMYVKSGILDIYYHSTLGSRRLVNSLLQQHYPQISLCHRTWEWFDADGDGKYLDLLVGFRECWNKAEEPPMPWAPTYYAIFASENWVFRSVADFDLGDYSLQVAWAKGPFIIRTRAQSLSQLEIIVYLLTDGNLVKIADLDNQDLSDPITRFLKRSRRLDIKTLNGYQSYYADEIQKTLEKQQNIKGLDKLIGAFEIAKTLKISSSEGSIGDQVLQIGNVEIPITTKTEDQQGLGTVRVAEFSLYRINKIVTEENCSFDGFDQLDDFFGAYVMPRQGKDMKHKSNDFMIVCQNKDAQSTAMNRGGWALEIKVLPKEFEDR